MDLVIFKCAVDVIFVIVITAVDILSFFLTFFLSVT